MADLYLMDDLKDAVAIFMDSHLKKDNIMDIYLLAEKYTAEKLRKMCTDFVDTSLSILEVLGVDAGGMKKDGVIKKNMIVRCRRNSAWWCDDKTEICTMPKESYPIPPPVPRTKREVECKAGTLGRVVGDTPGKIRVKWVKVKDLSYSPFCLVINADIKDLDILTPPMTISGVGDLEAIAYLFSHP